MSAALTSFMRTGWPPDPTPGSEPAEVAPYAAKRRAAVSAAFGGQAIVVRAGAARMRNDDVPYPYRANSDYVWLTGDTSPDGVLVMVPDGGGHTATLYVRVSASRHESAEFYRDRAYGELWTGRQRGVVEAAAALGLLVRPLAELDGALAALPGGYLNSADDGGLGEHVVGSAIGKDDWEIAQLADAVAATVRGFEDIVRELGAARASSERWIEGTFWRRARVEGNDVGYASIAAAGDHACVLHWTRNDGPVRDGDLLLVDAGVENHALYTADVTRTIPISGRLHRTAAPGVSVGIRGAIGCACGGSGRGRDVLTSWTGFSDRPSYADAEAILDATRKAYIAGELDLVVLVYNRFVSALQQQVEDIELLPIPEGDLAGLDAKERAQQGELLFEPEAGEMLGELLVSSLEVTVYRALLESTASEHGARMTAMRNASENAADLISAYTLAMNRARQAEITQEILEVVAGADALQ